MRDYGNDNDEDESEKVCKSLSQNGCFANHYNVPAEMKLQFSFDIFQNNVDKYIRFLHGLRSGESLLCLMLLDLSEFSRSLFGNMYDKGLMMKKYSTTLACTRYATHYSVRE